MTKKLKDISRLLNNTKIIVSLVVVAIIIVGIIFNRTTHTPLYENLQGVCNIDFDKSHFYRQIDFRPLDNNIFITKGNICLPVMLTTNDNIKGTYKELDELEKNSQGTWKIISTNPDSILIETPKSILNGRYSVIFEKINTPRERINYNVIFKNDSTYMVCTKEIYKLSITSQ